MSLSTGGSLILEDGTRFDGHLIGHRAACHGEVVFSTGMVGYAESLTDPSYRGQILTFTFPSIGNYGVPDPGRDDWGLNDAFESNRIHATAVVVAAHADDATHWSAGRSFSKWLQAKEVPGIAGVDTRALTQHLRDKGSMRAALVADGETPVFKDDKPRDLVAEVSLPEPRDYGNDGPRLVLLDTGVKENIIRSLVLAGARVLRVPHNFDFFGEDFDGVFLANGPGDPQDAMASIALVRRALQERIPLFGICLGHQLLSIAAGAQTYKLKFGHRGHNQPCVEVGTRRCFITSQNHGYAVDGRTLPDGWREWFVNANDGSNEGIRHDYLPVRSVQFHPEAAPGPRDTMHLFRLFVEMLR